MCVLAVALGTGRDPVGAGSPATAAVSGDPVVHLTAILERSPAPEYRRFGSPGMAGAADYAAGVLAAAGYAVLRHDVPADGYRVDYRPGHEPRLERVADGRSFPTESAFQLGTTTPAEGITCVLRPVNQVTPGDCGFVPFGLVSPEWNNFLADVPGQVDQVIARGGVGVVLQGDLEHSALIAVRVRRPIPTVVSVVAAADVIDQPVRLRVEGGGVSTTLHNIVAVRPPADPSAGYIVLQGHLDGWFAAAADNGAGSAAVLAAAERLAGSVPGRRGLLVALYDGEEWGLLGSKAFVADLADADGVTFGACGPTVRLDDVAAVVNLDASSAKASDVTGPVEDLLGLTVPLFSWRVLVFSEEATLASIFLQEMLTAGVLGAPLPVSVADPINGGMSRTDGRWFHEAGIPVAWPVAGYPEYHTSADVADTVDPVDLGAVTVGAAALVQALDSAPVARIGGALGAPGSVPEPARPAACASPVPAAAPAAALGVDSVDGSLPATGEPRDAFLGAAAVAVALLARVIGRRRFRQAG